MRDTIYRQSAIDALDKRFDDVPMELTTEILELRKDLRERIPSAQPERQKGFWMRLTEGRIPEVYMCPFCHRTIEDEGIEDMLAIRYPFCHCGADLRG